MSTTETTNDTTTEAIDLLVTTDFRGALTMLREGIGDLAKDLSGRTDIEGDGLVEILAGLRTLEILDTDIERMEVVFVERRLEMEAKRKAEQESLLEAERQASAEKVAHAIHARLGAKGLAVVSRKAKRAAGKRRAA